MTCEYCGKDTEVMIVLQEVISWQDEDGQWCCSDAFNIPYEKCPNCETVYITGETLRVRQLHQDRRVEI